MPLDAAWTERLGPVGFAGVARTVLAPNGELVSVKEAVAEAGPDQVLVVHGPTDRAIWGGSLAAAAHDRKAVGAVIHGLLRDAAEIAAVPSFGVIACGRRARRSDPAAVGARDLPIAV
ncbi:MAG: RraA family protein, partial [Trueperaceae bacterium]